MKQGRSLIIFIAIAMMPISGFGQERSTSNETTNKEKKISYAFSYESGFYIGKFFDIGLTRGMTGVFVNGIRFNKTQDEIGIGIGYDSEYDGEWAMFFPVYFNYRHYFSSKGKIKPLINIGLGTRFNFDDIWYGRPSKIECISGLYSTIATGFKAKSFSFIAGLFIKSWEWDFEYSAGVEIKAGFTF